MSQLGRPPHELRAEARSHMARGDLLAAKRALIGALSNVVVREQEYIEAVTELREVLVRMGDPRGALTVSWYADTERMHRQLIDDVPAIDRARTLLAWAERHDPGSRQQTLFSRAAEEYESAGLVAQAAIARERAEDYVAARALWSRLAQLLSSSGHSHNLYPAALARFNLARMSRRTNDHRTAREAVVSAVHLLEEAADRYETIGQRERAFDCFQVLIEVGRESGEFEHVLEGYVNVIRILREDHLRYYALQSYEEALEAAEKQAEMAAAATLAREMSAYARTEGLLSVANFGTLSQARLWQAVAAQCVERSAAPEAAENALLAAVIAYGEAGQYRRVGELYGQLSGLELDESRRAHYARAGGRYDGAADLDIEASPLPAHLRHEVGFPDVWHDDLVEWEQAGTASQACADVILSPTMYAETMRRRALLARLVALDLEQAPEQEHGRRIELSVSLCEHLALVDLYIILAPLEALYRSDERDIQMGVVRALARFLYKRSFITLREALLSSHPPVVEEASRSLEELRFPHAFDPLARIYRETNNRLARTSALRAVAKIDTVEAAEFLLGVIEHDGVEERGAATEALKRARGGKFIDIARGSLPRLQGAPAAAVRDILSVRGLSA